MAKNEKPAAKDVPQETEPVDSALDAVTAERDELAKKVEALEYSLAKAPKPLASLADVPAGAQVAIELTADMALGNGDREAGTMLAIVQCCEGVEMAEVVTAFANPHRFNVRLVPAK